MLGKLHFLVSFCPLHRNYPTVALDRLLVPAINHNCVRLFANENGQVAAALIWARLSHEVSERMIHDQVPPRPEDWAGGPDLWFVDLIAPFGDGPKVARHIARNPPQEPFWFARLDGRGRVRKVVTGDALARPGSRVRAEVYGHGAD